MAGDSHREVACVAQDSVAGRSLRQRTVSWLYETASILMDDTRPFPFIPKGSRVLWTVCPNRSRLPFLFWPLSFHQ